MIETIHRGAITLSLLVLSVVAAVPAEQIRGLDLAAPVEVNVYGGPLTGPAPARASTPP